MTAQKIETAPHDLSTQTPAEIDTFLVAAHRDSARAVSHLEYAENDVHRSAGDEHVDGYSSPWKMTTEEAIEAATAKGFTYGITKLAKARETFAEVTAEIDRLDAEFTRRGGWSRFFLVQNAGGHIHNSLNCSTCNKFTSRGQSQTRFGWLPALSGQTEAEAVAEHGAILCTVCFPSAPVEWTNAHEVAKAERAAAQCSGSGTYLDSDKPHRTGYYSGNWGTCPQCAARPAVTKTGKLRAHKPE